MATLLFLPRGLESFVLESLVPTVVLEAKPPSPSIAVPDILNKIALCESGGTQFSSSGSLVENKNYRDGIHWSSDWGLFQINDYYHLASSEALGLDIMTEDGNTKYALLLYNNAGTTPWVPSQKCWG